jgi:N-methylhydantoinase B
MTAPAQSALDPVRLEIIRTGLQSIPDLIEADLMRTAYSPLIYEYKDYAVGLVDATGRSIALATHGLPGFLTNVLGEAVRDGLALYGRGRIEEDDIIISNFAGTMGQHLNNVIMYTPIFGDGELMAFMAVNVHWIDIGGTYPGSCIGTDTTELAQEGLHLRTVKLFKRGRLVEEVLRIIEYNTRLPEGLLGDLWAQHAGVIKGKQLFTELVARHGQSVLMEAIETIWSLSEAAARAAIRSVPEGVYEASSFLDDDGVERGKHIPVHVKVELKDGNFIVDYSGCGEQVRGPFNSGFHGGGAASACIAFKYLFSNDEPANEGSFAPVKIILPEGKFINASVTAPLGLYQTPLSTVVDTIIAAMAPVMPDKVAGGHHGAANVYGFSGVNPRDGRFYSFFDTSHGGWGGSAHADGAGPYKTIRHADNKDIPAETVEALYPLLVERCCWRPDSAGPGRHRGGLGVDKTFRALAPCDITIAFERHHCPPWGLYGGLPGNSAHAEVEPEGEHPRSVLKESRLRLNAGDRLHLHTGAGGGFGPPEERDPEAIRLDIAHGYVTRDQAKAVYGVALEENGAG